VETGKQSTAQLQDTVAGIHEKFGAPPPADPQPGQQQTESRVDPGPGVVEPPLDHDFIPRDTVRELLELFFSSLSKRHGSHWKLSGDESRALTPVTVDMVNEQGPRLFGESDNRALWIFMMVMGTFIAVRSEAGGRLIEWIMDTITGANKSKPRTDKPAEEKKDSTQPAGGSTTGAGSLAFSDSSGFQAPGKQH